MSKIERLPSGLTFEEFKELADRKPSLEGKWIYRLTQTFNDPEIKMPYPKFDLEYSEDRLFLSYEEAVLFIKCHIKDNSYCSWITQVPIGDLSWEHGAKWLFDKEGNLLDYTAINTFGKGIDAMFLGRPGDRQRFKVGDIVEVADKESVKLCVISSLEPDIEWCWGRYKRCMEDNYSYILDYSDDTLVVLDGPSYIYHDHISPLNIMKPRLSIPEDMKVEMKSWIGRAKKETEAEMFSNNKGRQLKKYKNADEYVGGLSDIYNPSLYIHIREEDNKPLLLLDDGYGMQVSLYIDSPEYADFKEFSGRLYGSQIKALQDYLEEIEQGKSRWWYILREWNQNPDHKSIPMDTPLPDYTSLF